MAASQIVHFKPVQEDAIEEGPAGDCMDHTVVSLGELMNG